MTTEGEGHSAPRRGRPAERRGQIAWQPDPVHHAVGSQRIGIRGFRQHASVYVDLVERGHTVDITNRGRLVAQMVPVKEPDSPLERWIAAGVVERAEESGSLLEIDPYPALPPGGYRERDPRADPREDRS